jgi:recombination protein RecT
MSNTQLKTVAGSAPATSKTTDLAHILTSPATLAQIKAALPKHMTAERMARVALTETRKIPKLAKCDARTFVGAVIQLSQLGLEPGGALGHAYLIPFENKREGTTDVQIIIGYRGMIDLARRSGQIASLQAVIVREGDDFNVMLGLNPDLRHVSSFDPEKAMTFVYAVAVFRDGARQFEVMSRAEVERIRNNSQGYKSAVQYNKKDNPWMTNFDEMAKKTVIRRLFKYLPVSIEMQKAVTLDERGDAGLSQIVDDLGSFDGTATEIDEDAPQIGHQAAESTDKQTGEVTGKAPVDDRPPLALDGAASATQFTYAEVREALDKARNLDQLEVAEDRIRGTPQQFHVELSELAGKRRTEMA